jgi:hypothetical protein
MLALVLQEPTVKPMAQSKAAAPMRWIVLEFITPSHASHATSGLQLILPFSKGQSRGVLPSGASRSDFCKP